jgi:phosphoserine phosphatase
MLGDDDFVRIFLGGVSVDVLRKAGQRAALMMSRKAHEPVLRQLFALQRAGAKVIVVTANVRPLVEPFIVDVLRFALPPGAATELAVDAEGRVRRDSPVHGWNVDGTKQRMVETYIAQHGISFSVAYGDQASDVPMLMAVDEATVVNPKEELHMEADRRHWQILTCRQSAMHFQAFQHEALRVAIIGGGWTGLYALKHCLQQGLRPR